MKQVLGYNLYFHSKKKKFVIEELVTTWVDDEITTQKVIKTNVISQPANDKELLKSLLIYVDGHTWDYWTSSRNLFMHYIQYEGARLYVERQDYVTIVYVDPQEETHAVEDAEKNFKNWVRDFYFNTVDPVKPKKKMNDYQKMRMASIITKWVAVACLGIVIYQFSNGGYQVSSTVLGIIMQVVFLLSLAFRYQMLTKCPRCGGKLEIDQTFEHHHEAYDTTEKTYEDVRVKDTSGNTVGYITVEGEKTTHHPESTSYSHSLKCKNKECHISNYSNNLIFRMLIWATVGIW